jgi:TolB-like protein
VARIPDRTVGVPPLAISASDTSIAALSYGLADLLATDLARSSRLTVVDRMRLDAVLRELKLANSGNVDAGTAPRVGRILGARRLVVGAVAQLPGGDLSINARVADVTTGGVAKAVSAHARWRGFSTPKRSWRSAFSTRSASRSPHPSAVPSRRIPHVT